MVGRTVQRPPYRGALGLLDWAADNWPYVSGKAIVSGIKLTSLSASEMLDVIHYFFEEDLRIESKEALEAISKTREQIYNTLYNRPYKSGVAFSGTGYNVSDASGQNENAFSKPSADTVKPFIPATQFDPDSSSPFGEKLDSPLK